MTGNLADVYRACFSPDGTAVAAFGETHSCSFLRVWDTLTAALRFVSGGSCAVCFSPDWTVLAAGRHKRIDLLDAMTGECLCTTTFKVESSQIIFITGAPPWSFRTLEI